MKHTFFVALSVAFLLAFSACKKDKKDDPKEETKLAIGDEHQGGIIFYLDGTGEHGLIVTKTDVSAGAVWGCSGTDITAATGTAIGTGSANTTAILASCTTDDIAADLCSDLSQNGYSDWYLPSLDELKEVWNNRDKIGGFTAAGYWTSTNLTDVNSRTVYFSSTGSPYPEAKTFSCRVRAIRSF